MTLPFISSSTANGKDPLTGSPITGFKWWNFTFPTVVDSGTNAISDFDNATNGQSSVSVAQRPRLPHRAKATQYGVTHRLIHRLVRALDRA